MRIEPSEGIAEFPQHLADKLAHLVRDGLREYAVPAGYKRTFRLDRKTVRALQILPPNQREK
jgi:hypothetical protein